MNLVLIPFHDWKKCEREGFRTRDSHFMQEFDNSPLVKKVLIIDRPISIAEIVLLGRSTRPQNGSIEYKRNGAVLTRVTEKTYVLDIRINEIAKPLLLRRSWTPYIFGRTKVVELVEDAISHLEMASDYVLFMSAPLFVPLIKRLKPSSMVFDAQDNLLKHSMYRDVPHLASYYQYCLDEADLVLSNSEETTRWFQQQRRDAIHIPNGVDTNMFDPSQHHEMPEDIVGIDPPIVGYAGKIQEMFDIQLMTRAVSEVSNASFVFIGQELNPAWSKPLWRFPNTHYLNDKLYSDLPRYLSMFDICIIPYNIERQHGVDPIKFYEYLAMGKPIVTTNIGNVGAFVDHPLVWIANTADDFIRGLTKYIGQLNADSPVKRVSSLPDECTWRFKANMIIQNIISLHESITS